MGSGDGSLLTAEEDDAERPEALWGSITGSDVDGLPGWDHR
jgi:hypothetical protein